MLGAALTLIKNTISPRQTANERLISAVTRGDPTGVEDAIRQGADIDAFDMNDLNALFHSIHLNNFWMSEFLLIEHKADPSARNTMGLTPLHVATSYGDRNTMSLLVRHKADPSGYCCEDKTPAMIAASYPEYVEALRYLIGIPVDLNLRQKGRFHTATMLAFVKGGQESFKALIGANAMFTEDQRCWCEIEQRVPDLFERGKAGNLPSSVQRLFEKLNATQLTVVPSPS